MKTFLRHFQLLLLLTAFATLGLSGSPRILKGTVSRDGKPLSGALVSVHKSKHRYFTSFDGKYEVKADSKSKWIKFSHSGQEFKRELDPNDSDYVDFQFPSQKDGIISEPGQKVAPARETK